MEHNIRIVSGGKVRFTGSSDLQVTFGNYDDPRKALVVGDVYIVENVEEHTWHTNVYLKGIRGRFNSVVFEPIIEARNTQEFGT